MLLIHHPHRNTQEVEAILGGQAESAGLSLTLQAYKKDW
jgi:hypothetical protein